MEQGQYSLPDVDNLSEEQYNNFGWVRYNDVLTTHEYSTLLSRYADYKHICVVLPAVVPIVKQLIKTFAILSSPSKLASFAYTFYTLATRLSNCFV